MGVQVLHGDMLEQLAALDPASVDSVVTDPPYGLAFMGRTWDHGVPGPGYWTACLRVLKPGGHLLAFGGTRTAHRLTSAIEDAGFEIRDTITWLHGQGFPKGKGQLKPASEPIIVARKPLSGTVAATVLAHGTGALNVDACRVEGVVPQVTQGVQRAASSYQVARSPQLSQPHSAGRWPANVVLTHTPDCGTNKGHLCAPSLSFPGECVHGHTLAPHTLAPDYDPDDDPDECANGCPVCELDTQSAGTRADRASGTHTRVQPGSVIGNGSTPGAFVSTSATGGGFNDTGGASRFFPTFRYQAKASSRERPKVDGVAHPTVKPLALMRWLVRLVTPPGGLVLDPFAGSGTTGEAAQLEGFNAILVERDETYLPLIAARLERVA